MGDRNQPRPATRLPYHARPLSGSSSFQRHTFCSLTFMPVRERLGIRARHGLPQRRDQVSRRWEQQRETDVVDERGGARDRTHAAAGYPPSTSA